MHLLYILSTALLTASFTVLQATPDTAALRDLKAAQTLYDFAGDTADELGFKAGEKIYIVQDMGDGWWEAKNENGEMGYVPEAYVELLTENEENEEGNYVITHFDYATMSGFHSWLCNERCRTNEDPWDFSDVLQLVYQLGDLKGGEPIGEDLSAAIQEYVQKTKPICEDICAPLKEYLNTVLYNMDPAEWLRQHGYKQDHTK